MGIIYAITSKYIKRCIIKLEIFGQIGVKLAKIIQFQILVSWFSWFTVIVSITKNVSHKVEFKKSKIVMSLPIREDDTF